LRAWRARFQTASGEISRREFFSLAELLLRDQPGIQNLGWIPRVSHAEREAFELAAARQGIPGYEIKSVTESGLTRSDERDEYFPVLYSATGSSTVYGLDLGSEPMRCGVLESARDSGKAAASSVFRLPPAVGDWRAFFVVMAVFKPGSAHDTVEARRRNLAGFVQGIFRIDAMVETIFARTTAPGGLDLILFEAPSDEDAAPIYFHSSRRREAPAEPQPLATLRAGPNWSTQIDVADRRWLLAAVPIPGSPGIPDHLAAWLSLIGGMLITAAVAAYIWSAGRQSVVALKLANAQLSEQNERFDAALQNLPQGLLMLDRDQRVAVCNDRYIEMYGLSRDIVRPGLPVQELLRHRAERSRLHRDLEKYRTQMLDDVAPGKTASAVAETPDGRAIAIASKAMGHGGWVITHEDITERRQTEARIAHMARHDPVTDLPNRIHFREEIGSRLSRLGRNERFAVLYLDLDNFKTINDTLGHPIGDKLLSMVGERLRSCIRGPDSIARLGGDEFGIVEGSVLQPQDAAALVSRIMEVLASPFDVDGHQVVAGVSVGIAIAPTDAADSDQLLKNADMALYRAKADGRGTHRFFDPDMDARMQARRALETDLRKAIACGEFELHYQPLVRLETEQICGFEALIRWHHPTRGFVPPRQFIPLAEETRLIVPIGEWVLRQACAEAAGWPEGIRVAVNVSPAQFRRPGLSEIVVSALANSGLEPARLEVEITESVLLLNSELTLATLHRLRELGVRISMDDFGTGYSSLSYLRSFPFDKIKIDGSFVRDLASNADSMAIVRAVAGLGSSLRMVTTAEGIETRVELEQLKREGCTEGQGYLFGKPLPAESVRDLLSSSSKAVA
jgi:diguanylate cyclase (GGDEF)-like protein/PAS domain S-box-containing protein